MTAAPALAAPASRPLPRRGLRRAEAAAYVGVGLSKWDALVKEGLMPQPRELHGCMVWDVREIDDRFDELPHRRESGDTPAIDDGAWSDVDL